MNDDGAEGMFSDVDNSVLNDKHWKDVCAAVSSISAKSRLLATNLGLKSGDIDSIFVNFPHSDKERSSEVMKYWLHLMFDYKNEGRPSWKTLVKAVHPIDTDLAESIAKLHKVRGGTQPSTTGKKRKRSQPVAQASTQQVPRLTDKDIVTVTNAIWKIRAKFYNLGMNLGIDTGTLDCASRKGDDGDALNSVIKTWLQRSEPKPTWSALVQALRGDNVKAGALADEIASKYCPDELKYEEEEVDTNLESDPEVEKFPRLSQDGSSPTSERKTIADPCWCTAVTKFEAQAGAGPVSRAPAAVAVIQALWNKTKLGVKFIGNKSLLSNWKLANGNQMITDLILSWANTWRLMCGSPNVPYFVDVDTESGLEDDIRVDFNGEGVNWSKVGMEATQYPNKATMQLSLTNAWSDGLKKHYIIHEFGHALGLGHEHQRSKFWQSLHPYVNLDKMKQDPDVGGDENFHINWAEEATGYYTSDAGEDSGEYDPQSIMHYGFKVKWLNRAPIGSREKDYSVWNNIQSDYDKKILPEDGYKVLYGVHQRANLSLAMNPSNEDISFLKKCYEPGTFNQLHGQTQEPSQIQDPQSGPPPSSDSHHQEQKVDHPSGLPSSSDSHNQEQKEDVENWSVDQVVKYFESTSNCQTFALFCREQEIDGDALLGLSEDFLIKYKVKAGLAVKVMRHVNKLNAEVSPEQ